MSLMRNDGSYTIYQIEFQPKDSEKWYTIEDKSFLAEYRSGQNSANGDYWQKTGIHGMFDLSYAATYCNKLNQASRIGTLSDEYNGANFRLIKVTVSQIKEVLSFDGYAAGGAI
ncbi:MAG: hypothetical protein GXY05_13760 [Clostridiales bacterium]|nr:hypothetical protein [Clostridiales bacterium]